MATVHRSPEGAKSVEMALTQRMHASGESANTIAAALGVGVPGLSDKCPHRTASAFSLWQ